MALLELNAELEGFILRFELKNKRLRTLGSGLFLAAFAARFIARQPPLHDAMEHLDHFLFGTLPRNLKQERLRKAALLDAPLPQAGAAGGSLPGVCAGRPGSGAAGPAWGGSGLGESRAGAPRRYSLSAVLRSARQAASPARWVARFSSTRWIASPPSFLYSPAPGH